MIVMIVTN